MDRESRSAALEQMHVHDVYDRTAHHFTNIRYRAWPKVERFLQDLEPGSLVADVGCGSGKYLHINPEVYAVGSDRCSRLVDIARHPGHAVMVSDNLALPYRNNCFDAVISIGVIHHLTTRRRRVQALKELARILRPGGKLMIYVWAMEQQKRKFDAQDVLVPWHFPPKEKLPKDYMKIEKDPSSVSSVSEDEGVDEPLMGYGRFHTRPSNWRKSYMSPSAKAMHPGLSTAKSLDRSLTMDRSLAKAKIHFHSDTDLSLPNAENGKYLFYGNAIKSNFVKSVAPPLFSSAKGKCLDLPDDKIRRNKKESICRKAQIKRQESFSLSESLKTKFKSLFSNAEKEMSTLSSPKSNCFVKDAEYKKLIQYIMKEEADFFAASRPVLEHSLSVPETDEIFAVREFPQSSQPLTKQKSLDSTTKQYKSEFLTKEHNSTLLDGEISGKSSLGKGEGGSLFNGHCQCNITGKYSSLTPDLHNESNPNLRLKYDTKQCEHSYQSIGNGLNKNGKLYQEESSQGDDESSNGSHGFEYHHMAEIETSPEDEQFKNKDIGINGDHAILNVSKKCFNKTEDMNTQKTNCPLMGKSTVMFSEVSPTGAFGISTPDISDSDTGEWAKKTVEAIQAMQVEVMRKAGIDTDNPIYCSHTPKGESHTSPYICFDQNIKKCGSECYGSSNGSDTDITLSRVHTRGSETWSVISDGYSESVSDCDESEACDILGQSLLPDSHGPQQDEINQKKKSDDKSNCKIKSTEHVEQEPTYHRYYHVFKQGELPELIDKYVDCLHILQSYYDHANWCVVAEKVTVWTL